ncbi:hypothetical protein SALBM311S_02962 [Streptomyces alboniger]
MIRDRNGKYPALFDTVLEDAGIEVVLSGIRMPRMNALMERWVQTCRNTAPVAYDASGDISHAMAAAISSACPRPPQGNRAGQRIRTVRVDAIVACISVSIIPGATALTRTPSGPSSLARPTVRASTAALVAA